MMMLRAAFLLALSVAFIKLVTADVEVTFAGCKWDSVDQSHKEGGKGIGEINTEEDCAQKCRETEECSAFDYDGRKNAWRGIHCWLHLESKHKSVAIEPADGVVFYQFLSCEAAKPNAPTLQRTVILIRAPTNPDEYIFFRGGIDFDVRQECFDEAVGTRESSCSIPIRHNNLPQENEKLLAYRTWSVNDQVLDWGSSEPEQGIYKNFFAEGSPGLWTTNNAEDDLYTSINEYGEHYWMLDVDMDCSRTVDGWFDFKTFKLNMVSNRREWEKDVIGDQNCGVAGSAPYSSKNHHAKCGALNVFTQGGADCMITNIENLS